MAADAEKLREQRWQEIVGAEKLAATEIELLKRFVRHFPRHGGAWHRLGRRLTDLSRFDEAGRALRKAIRLFPREKRLFVFCSVGVMYRERGNACAAERWFRKAISHSPDDAQGYIFLGGMLARLGRLDEAEAVHRKGTHCIDEAFLNLGYVLRAKERYAEAFGCFDRALALDPKYQSARVARRDVSRVMKLRGGGRKD